MSSSFFYQNPYTSQPYDPLWAYQDDQLLSLYLSMASQEMEREEDPQYPPGSGVPFVDGIYRQPAAAQVPSSPVDSWTSAQGMNTPTSSLEFDPAQLPYPGMEGSPGYTSDASWVILGSSQDLVAQHSSSISSSHGITVHAAEDTSSTVRNTPHGNVHTADPSLLQDAGNNNLWQSYGHNTSQPLLSQPFAPSLAAPSADPQLRPLSSAWGPISRALLSDLGPDNPQPNSTEQVSREWFHNQPTPGFQWQPNMFNAGTWLDHNYTPASDMVNQLEPTPAPSHSVLPRRDVQLPIRQPHKSSSNALMSRGQGLVPQAHGLQPRKTTERPLRPSRIDTASSEDNRTRSRKGGRKGALTEAQRIQSNKSREDMSCWICAMQRDPCKGPEFCTRCTQRSLRGDSNRLDCTRKELRSMTIVFLPKSMTAMHQRDSLIAYVKERATSWHGTGNASGVLVDLSIGFGPSFTWLLHEFTPAWPSLLSRLDSVWDENDQVWKTVERRSPPLGVQYLPAKTGDSLEHFLERVVVDGLKDLAKAYDYEGDKFKPKILRLFCDLLSDLLKEKTDQLLQEDLKEVLKMIVATFVMNHALTITKQSRDEVLKRLSGDHDPSEYPEEPSPWMASMQLRCFFAIVRTNLYESNLRRLQQILHKSTGKKERTHAFVGVLGMAFVLEVCHHIILLQAKGKVDRREADEATAWRNVGYECGEIDHEFEFLRNLLHCKYQNGRMTQKASLLEWINTTPRPLEKKFLQAVYDETVNNREYLLSRKDLGLKSAAENNHASRLLSRLLVDLVE